MIDHLRNVYGSLCFLMLVPLFWQVLRYVGDDGRSHDPANGLVVVTILFSILLLVLAGLVHGYYKAFSKNVPEDYSVVGNALVTCIPSLLVYLGLLHYQL